MRQHQNEREQKTSPRQPVLFPVPVKQDEKHDRGDDARQREYEYVCRQGHFSFLCGEEKKAQSRVMETFFPQARAYRASVENVMFFRPRSTAAM